jgi:hypothetical protein
MPNNFQKLNRNEIDVISKLADCNLYGKDN